MTHRIDLNWLEDEVEEKSTATIEANFKDSSQATFSPNTITWTLTDLQGNTFATGSETPASSVDIYLSGDQLRLATGFSGRSDTRVLLVEAEFNTGPLINAPLRNSCRFKLRNLIAVT